MSNRDDGSEIEREDGGEIGERMDDHDASCARLRVDDDVRNIDRER